MMESNMDRIVLELKALWPKMNEKMGEYCSGVQDCVVCVFNNIAGDEVQCLRDYVKDAMENLP
jgi:hypothetical protein